MIAFRIDRALLLVLLACFAIFSLPRTSAGQTEERTPTSVEHAVDVDIEVQLHLLVASNAAESAKLPVTDRILFEVSPEVKENTDCGVE